MKTDSVSNQLRWVILLLAAAVILPTVCLLWFMNQAVRNERLAVRQKLIDVCNENIQNLEGTLIEVMASDYKLTTISEEQASEIQLWLNAIKKDADSVVIYDNNGKLVYPFIKLETTPEYSEVISGEK